MKQYLIQYLNIVVGVLATVLDVNRYFWIDRINYIYESITQKQLFSTFPHAGQGAPKTLTVFTYSVEYPTVALKGSMHRKKKWTFKTQKANPANVLINLTTRQITETACKYPPEKYDTGTVSRGQSKVLNTSGLFRQRRFVTHGAI